MQRPYKFLAHKIFQKYAEQFEASNPRAVRSFRKQCEKAATNPSTAGKPMRGIASADLQGTLYRVWVKGPRGFRVIYLVDAQRHIVCPIFLSPLPRKDFDYEDVPWQQDAWEIFSSLVEGREEDFQEWTF